MAESWGYARFSTEEERGSQIRALWDAGVRDDHIVQETVSGNAGTDRPLYAALVARLQKDDRLVVWKVDQLGRNTLDALQTAKLLDARGVHVVITTLGVDLKTPTRVVFGLMAQIAEFERQQIRERIIAGIAEARTRPGFQIGRRPTLARATC